MKLTVRPSPAVVAGWGILNGILALVLVGFGATSQEFPIYLAAAGLVIVNAAAVSFALRRQRVRTWREAPPGDSVFILALGILAAALGWAYSWYFLPVAAVPIILAILRELKVRRQRRSA